MPEVIEQTLHTDRSTFVENWQRNAGPFYCYLQAEETGGFNPWSFTEGASWHLGESAWDSEEMVMFNRPRVALMSRNQTYYYRFGDRLGSKLVANKVANILNAKRKRNAPRKRTEPKFLVKFTVKHDRERKVFNVIAVFAPSNGDNSKPSYSVFECLYGEHTNMILS